MHPEPAPDFTTTAVPICGRPAAINRRQILQAGGLDCWVWACRSCWPPGPPARRWPATAGGRIWPGQAVHLSVHVGRTEPARHVRHEARRAGREVRGPFQPISTRVPGMQICEHFDRLAELTDKLAIVRSLNHTDPAHLSSGHATLTGHLAPKINSDADPPSERDTPHIGSMLARVAQRRRARCRRSSRMPWLAYHPSAPGGKAPGQHGGWLGREYDPLLVTGDPNAPDWRVQELSLADGISYERIDSRRELLADIDRQRAELGSGRRDGTEGTGVRPAGLARRSRQAFDLAQEPEAVRDRYGRNIHGQCVLLARRLIEHGVPLVSVNWHNDGQQLLGHARPQLLAAEDAS